MISSWIDYILTVACWYSLLPIAHQLCWNFLVLSCMDRASNLWSRIVFMVFIQSCQVASPVVNYCLFLVVLTFRFVLNGHRCVGLSPYLFGFLNFCKGPIIIPYLLFILHSETFSCGINTLIDWVVDTHAHNLAGCTTCCPRSLWCVISALNGRLNLWVLMATVSIILHLLLAIWVCDSIEISLCNLRGMPHTSTHIRLDRHHVHRLNGF